MASMGPDWRLVPSQGPRAANGKQRAGRARQFLPFAALRGYYDLLREQERVVEPRRDLPQEEIERISRAIAQLRKGDLVRVTHYDVDAYATTEGVVTRIDIAGKAIDIVKRRIAFDDILDIAGEGIEDGQPLEPA